MKENKTIITGNWDLWFWANTSSDARIYVEGAIILHFV